MNILFVDTETTGLPSNYKAPPSDVDNWPRIIQMAWLLTDEKGLIKNLGLYLVKPNGWEVPAKPWWIEHGFTQEKSMAEGVPIGEVLGHFLIDQMESDLLVSHNIQFDYPIIAAEMIRAGVKGKKVPRICTKESGTDFCQLPSVAKWMGYKWPTLQELHVKLFETEFKGAHDAFDDVQACAKCFFELVKRNIIHLPILTQ